MPTLLPKRHAQDALACILLLLAAAAAYSQVVFCDFINLDDQLYVTENPHVLKGLTVEGLRWALSFESNAYFSPLAWLSFMLDAQIFGLKAGGFHAVNVLLHALNAALLFLAFRRMTGRTWPSAAVAALFAVHPMHVESVAWITERKDMLSTLFCFLTILAYARHAQRPSLARYLTVALCFTLGLMSKAMLVTLPCVLLLLDFWPLGRTLWWSRSGEPQFSPAPVHRLALEKLPLLALSLLATATAWLSHAKAPLVAAIDYPVPLRLANAVVSYVRYLAKLVWPADISVVFPFPETVPAWQWAGALVLLSAITLFVLRQASVRPHLFVGWLWFLGTLVPVLKLYNLGLWYSIAARFTYVPYIGLYALACFEAPALAERLRIPRKALAAAACLVVAILAADARVNVGYWSDSVSLFRHALAVTENNFIAHTNLGLGLLELGKADEALPHFREAVRLVPNDPSVRDRYGMGLAHIGRPADALPQFWEALRLDPNYILALNNLGGTLNTLGRPGEAIAHLEKALRLQPDLVTARMHLATSFYLLGRYENAVPQLREILRLKPGTFSVAFNLGAALLQLNRPVEAVLAFEQSLRIKPGDAQAQRALEIARRKAGETPRPPAATASRPPGWLP